MLVSGYEEFLPSLILRERVFLICIGLKYGTTPITRIFERFYRRKKGIRVVFLQHILTVDL